LDNHDWGRFRKRKKSYPLLENLSPLGWEHINLTGDYLWRSSAKIGTGRRCSN
jgi:hypothetical protein